MTNHEIQTSSDYSKFSFLPKNRKIDYKKLMRFIKESKEKPYLMEVCPILVNSAMQIMDGQHRFLACKENKIPVYYIKSDLIHDHDIITLNKDQKNWTLEDYINFHCESGNANYKKLINFCSENQCTSSLAFLFLGISNRKTSIHIKEGTMLFPCEEIESIAAYKIKKCIQLQKKAKDPSVRLNKEGIHVFAFGYTFMEAISNIKSTENLPLFFENLERNLEKIQHCRSFSKYIDQFHFLKLFQ